MRLIPHFFFLLLLTISCTTPPATNWKSEPDQGRLAWRQFYLFDGEDALVLASHELAASEAHQWVARARAAVAANDGLPTKRCLVIVLSEKDGPLFDDPGEYQRVLQQWGADSNMRINTSPRNQEEGKPLEFDQCLVFSLAPAAAPTDDPDLNLPTTFQEQFHHVLIMPTDSYIESVCSALVEASFEASGASWLQRQVVYASMDPSEMMVEKITPGVRSALVHCWASITGLTGAQRNVVRQEFNLSSKSVDPKNRRKEGAGNREPKVAREMILETKGTVLEDDLELGVARTPMSHEFDLMRSMYWSLIVDLNPHRSNKDQALQVDPPYNWLPTANAMPVRSDVEAFEELRRTHPGFILVTKDNVTEAAAFLAAHAFWMKGLPVDEALALGVRFGLQPQQVAALRELFASE